MIWLLRLLSPAAAKRAERSRAIGKLERTNR